MLCQISAAGSLAAAAADVAGAGAAVRYYWKPATRSTVFDLVFIFDFTIEKKMVFLLGI